MTTALDRKTATPCAITLYTATYAVGVELAVFASGWFGSLASALAWMLFLGGGMLTVFSGPTRSFGAGLAIAGAVPLLWPVLCGVLALSIYALA